MWANHIFSAWLKLHFFDFHSKLNSYGHKLLCQFIRVKKLIKFRLFEARLNRLSYASKDNIKIILIKDNLYLVPIKDNLYLVAFF